MSNLSIKIDLAKLQSSALVNITGKTGTKKCIVIPVEDAGLYVGEKGVYLDLTAFELREVKFDQTHIVKQSMKKELYNSLTEEERNAIPIIGGIKMFQSPSMPSDNLTLSPEEADDLPF